MLTRQQYVRLMKRALEQRQQLLDVCNRSVGVEAIFVLTADVYAAMMNYGLPDGEILSNYNEEEMKAYVLLYGSKIFVIKEEMPGTLFSAAICRSDDNYNICGGLHRGDLLVDSGQMYSFEPDGQCSRFIDLELTVSNGISYEHIYRMARAGSTQDVTVTRSIDVECAHVRRKRANSFEVYESKRQQLLNVFTSKLEEEGLNAGDTKALDDFLESFSKSGTLMQAGG